MTAYASEQNHLNKSKKGQCQDFFFPLKMSISMTDNTSEESQCLDDSDLTAVLQGCHCMRAGYQYLLL